MATTVLLPTTEEEFERLDPTELLARAARAYGVYCMVLDHYHAKYSVRRQDSDAVVHALFNLIMERAGDGFVNRENGLNDLLCMLAELSGRDVDTIASLLTNMYTEASFGFQPYIIFPDASTIKRQPIIEPAHV